MFENRQPDKQLLKFLGIDGAVSLRKREFIQILADAFDNVLYNSVECDRYIENRLNNKDKKYYSNSAYWKDTLLDYNYVGQTIVLNDFAIIEWLPSSPGRFLREKLKTQEEKLKAILIQTIMNICP